MIREEGVRVGGQRWGPHGNGKLWDLANRVGGATSATMLGMRRSFRKLLMRANSKEVQIRDISVQNSIFARSLGNTWQWRLALIGQACQRTGRQNRRSRSARSSGGICWRMFCHVE